MKKKIIAILITFLFIPSVNAQCDNTRINELKSLAQNIEIIYELDPNKTSEELSEYDPDDIAEGVVRIIISGLTEEFLIIDSLTDESYNYYDTEDGIIMIPNITKGTKNYYVYSSECDKKIRTLTIRIPTYNKYSTDPLCEGISADDLSICNTWYEGKLDYETFKSKIEKYKQSEMERQNQKVEINILDKIVEFFKNNYIYIALGIIIIVIAIIAIKVRRKRSVLE